MIKESDIIEARNQGVFFICSMCLHWHAGQDSKVKNSHGEGQCVSRTCKGILSGGAFDEYQGPLKGYLSSYCHACGKHMPEHILEPKRDVSCNRVGCCIECLKMIKGLMPQPKHDNTERRILWAHQKEPDRYEVD